MVNESILQHNFIIINCRKKMKKISNILGSKKFFHGWTYIYVVFLCINFISSLYYKNYMKSHCFADLFINYEGGFVKRGLLGELLLYGYQFGINPFSIAICLCLISYITISIYMVRNFSERKYDLCILTITPLLGGLCQYSIDTYRRDFMMLTLFLLMVQLWKKMHLGNWLLIGNIIFSLSLLCYEPFIFFALPFIITLTHIKIGKWTKSIFYWLPSILVFVLTCIYSGGKHIYEAIAASTSQFLENPGIMNFLLDNSKDVMLFHLNINCLYGVSKTPSLLVSTWIIGCMIYLTTNIVAVYSNNKNMWQQRRYILALLLFALLFLLPMFTVLSIDYARIFTSALLSIYIIYFSLTEHELQMILPQKLYKLCDTILSRQDRYLKPTGFKMIFIILFVGLAQCSGMGIIESIKSAQLGTIIRIIYHHLDIILS